MTKAQTLMETLEGTLEELQAEVARWTGGDLRCPISASRAPRIDCPRKEVYEVWGWVSCCAERLAWLDDALADIDRKLGTQPQFEEQLHLREMRSEGGIQ